MLRCSVSFRKACCKGVDMAGPYRRVSDENSMYRRGFPSACRLRQADTADGGSTGRRDQATGGTVDAAQRVAAILTVEPVAPGEFSATRTYFGRTAFRPKALSAVTAPFAGRVARVSIEPGQRVRAGATLFTIESPDAMGVRTALSQARLKVRLQEEVLARQTEMVKRGVGLEVERFEAEMKLREARAELERSERNAALLGAGEGASVHVRAPVDGVVVGVKAAAGATVQLGGDP